MYFLTYKHSRVSHGGSTIPHVGAYVTKTAMVLRCFQAIRPAIWDFDGFRIEIKRIINGGDTLVVEARYKATAKATGKPFDSQTVHVWDFNSSGKIVKFQQYTDTFQAARVTGITPKA